MRKRAWIRASFEYPCKSGRKIQDADSREPLRSNLVNLEGQLLSVCFCLVPQDCASLLAVSLGLESGERILIAQILAVSSLGREWGR